MNGNQSVFNLFFNLIVNKKVGARGPLISMRERKAALPNDQ